MMTAAPHVVYSSRSRGVRISRWESPTRSATLHKSDYAIANCVRYSRRQMLVDHQRSADRTEIEYHRFPFDQFGAIA